MLTLIILIAFAAGFLYWSDKSITASYYPIASRAVPTAFDGFVIVQVSDLQSSRFGRNQERLTKAVDKASPDIIIFTGDLPDRNHTDYQASLQAMERLAAIAPVYYVNGNHELALPFDEISQMYDAMKPMGIHLLFDRSEAICRGRDRLILLGISEETLYAAKGVSPGGLQPGRMDTAFDASTIIREIEAIADGLQPSDLVVLLVHEPQYLDTYAVAAEGRVDLVFSGHAHGGQIRLPFTEGLFAPGQGILPKLTSGVHQQGNTKMVISRGLGNSTFPFRLFNRPEIVVCRLAMEEIENY